MNHSKEKFHSRPHLYNSPQQLSYESYFYNVLISQLCCIRNTSHFNALQYSSTTHYDPNNNHTVELAPVWQIQQKAWRL